MNKNTILGILLFLSGILLTSGWFQCHPEFKTTTVVRTDTLVYMNDVEIPVPHTVYKEVVKYMWVDTSHVDTIKQYVLQPIKVDIPAQEYCDSILNKNYRLDWRILTEGTLLEFQPDVTVYHRDTTKTNTIQQPKFTIGIGANYYNGFKPSLSFGYKNWEVGYSNAVYAQYKLHF